MNQVSHKVRQSPLLAGVIIVIGLLGIAAAWWLGSPLFINNRVEEAFPIVPTQAISISPTQVATAVTSAEGISVQAAATSVVTNIEPIAVSAGKFRDGDSFHKGTGDVSLYSLADGSFILRFENFNVTNGPDLHVYLVKAVDPVTTDDVNSRGYLDIGSLKGNQGAQNYTIPAGTDISQYNSVVIYCQPFHVVFSVAPLA